MISEKLVRMLNHQILLEAQASNSYLAMASWAEIKGFEGTSKFFYSQSSEERSHMLKLFHYINERGGHAIVPTTTDVKLQFNTIQDLFSAFLESEKHVSAEINNLVEGTLAEKDYTTHNFLQWYVAEQIEEERVSRMLIDRLDLIGSDKAGLYLFDRDCGILATESDG
jgi:ferritin